MKVTIIVLCVFAAASAEAKRAEPAPVVPVTHNGIVYVAPHSRMGYVEAYDATTKQKLWSQRVYGVEYGSAAEKDDEDVFVKSLSIENGALVVVNEANHRFTVDLHNREVTVPCKGVVAFESGGDADAWCFGDLVEITCLFMRFRSGDAAVLAQRGQLDAGHLLRMWHEDRGQLLAMPRVTTFSGQEASVRSVTEVIYPTELAMPSGAATNALPSPPIAPVPSAFETREVGVIMTVCPEVGPNGKSIRVVVSSELVEEPVWKTYSSQFPGSTGRPIEVSLDQPFFRTCAFSTSVAVTNGGTVLLGGGIPTSDKAGTVFAFLKARVVGRAEEPSSDAAPGGRTRLTE